MPLPAPPLLALSNFTVDFSTEDGLVHAVRGIDLTLEAGECLCIVGESGSGKSQTCLATLGLTAPNAQISGKALYRGEDLRAMSKARLRALRGRKISMIFQDPLTSLTPHMTVGAQLREILTRNRTRRRHASQPERPARAKRPAGSGPLAASEQSTRPGAAPADQPDDTILAILERVRIPEAARRLRQYPHELSGGMRQRVMIAMALLGTPDVLFADEPTTALDVTVQAQILEIITDLKEDRKMGLVLITHDMGVVAKMADKVAVMHQGRIVETGPVHEIFDAPEEAYTRMLLDAMPRLDGTHRGDRSAILPIAPEAGTVLEATDIEVRYPVKIGGGFIPAKKDLRAVDGVSFTLRAGETLGVVGESGCGKSTLARAVLQFAPIRQSGSRSSVGVTPRKAPVIFMGHDLSSADKRSLRQRRRDLQIVFQDPLAALDPRMTIGSLIAEPFTVHAPHLSKAQQSEKVAHMMARVGLSDALKNRYPHELSGGQNQRVGIARAVVLNPQLIICDEAVSALDVSVQATIIELLIELQNEMGMALLFISHDLSVVREVSHRVMVLYLGQVMELAPSDIIYTDAQHPYTKSLIAAVPMPDPRAERAKPRLALEGDLPSALDSRASLRFMKSRLIDDPDAEQYRPKLIEVAPDHFVAEHDPI